MIPRGVSASLLTIPRAGAWRAVRLTTRDSGLSRPVATPAPAPATITLPRMRIITRATVSDCKKSFRSTVTWPCALTACAPAIGQGLLVSFLNPNRLGFATLFLPGQAGFSRKSLRRFGEQPAEKPFDLRRQHPDELLRSRAQAGTLEHHKDTERQEHDRHVFLVEVHSEVPSGELLARRWKVRFTLRRISPVLKPSPRARARARAQVLDRFLQDLFFRDVPSGAHVRCCSGRPGGSFPPGSRHGTAHVRRKSRCTHSQAGREGNRRTPAACSSRPRPGSFSRLSGTSGSARRSI